MATTADANALPATLQWYRDGANWIVGLSTGAIAASIAYYDKFVLLDRLALAVLLLAMGAFTLSVLCGILFYIWVIAYGNQREYVERLQRDLAAAAGDAHKTHALKLQITASEAKRDGALEHMRAFYKPLLWTFFAGVIALALSAGAYIANPRPPETLWSVQTMTTTAAPTSPGEHAQSLVIRLDTKSGEAWFLVTGTDAKPVWRRIANEREPGVAAR
jgi:hypothetical protein